MTRRRAWFVSWLGAVVFYAVLLFVLFACATDPALLAYDRAVAAGLAAPRIERANARFCDDSPLMGRRRCVETER